MEMVGPSKRLVAGVVCQMFFSTGYILTAAFVYFIDDWRKLQLALTLPGLVFLCYWWYVLINLILNVFISHTLLLLRFIPESARWLLTKNRLQDAKALIKIQAKENKVDMSDDLIETLLKTDNNSIKDDKKATLFDLFRSPNLRKKAFVIFFDWYEHYLTFKLLLY